ncbi:sensor histidine kinase [soil metagenome]
MPPSSAELERLDGPDAAGRLMPVWHVLLAGTLALPTTVALAVGDLSARDLLMVLALVGCLAVGHWAVLARHPHWWQRRLLPLAAYWVVACGVVVLLVRLEDSFTVLMYGVVPMLFITLGWWALLPIAALTGAIGLALGSRGDGPATVGNLLATVALSVVIGGFVDAVTRQSEQRRDALATLAATRAELAENARRAGVLEERERLSRALHDTLAQSFTSVVTHLEAAEQALDERTADARRHLDTARRTAREGLGDVRRSVRALRPDLLEDDGLQGALERVVRRWSEDTGVPAELRSTGRSFALRPDAETALLRTTQEALVNVARHAQASRVVVSLSYLDDVVTLDVDDEGVGFDGMPRPRPDGGFGLVGIGERIAAVGGELSIDAAAGRGTTVAVSVPA